MRLLIVSTLPTHPQDEGANRRVFAMMEVLRHAGHEVHFALVPRNQADIGAMRRYWGERLHLLAYRDPVAGLKRQLIKLKSRIGRGHDYGIDDWYDPALDAQIAQLRERLQPQAVLAEYVYLSRCLDLFDERCLKLIDTHDVMADRHARCIAQGQRPRWFSTTGAEECRGLRRADVVIAIQQREQELLTQRLPDRRVITVEHVVPVDLRWRFDPARQSLLYVGTNNPSNVQAIDWFIGAVMPLLTARWPALTLHVAGKVCQQLTPVPNLVCHGVVDDLDALYMGASASINPVQFGTGLKIKNVEAMSCGCPLVTTGVGAEGMEAFAGQGYLLADSPAEMAAAIGELLSQRQLAERLSLGGGELVRMMNARSSAALLDAMAAAPAPAATPQRATMS